MKIAACYIRVSTDDQLEYSPDSQLTAIKKYAAANDMLLSEDYIFIEQDGVSGRKADSRPEFQRMIGTAKTKPKPFDVVLLWKFSRFARNREDSIVYKSMLRKQLGIEVISISENVGDDKMSVIFEAMIEAMDEYYSINLAEEVKRGMTEKAKRGEVLSIAPFGYKLINKELVIDEKRAELIKLVFVKYSEGATLRGIAAWLNDIGVRTERGNKIENRTVEYWLRNPVYNGYIRWTPTGKMRRNYDNPDSIIAKGKHMPIIGDELWESVQRRISEQKEKHCHYRREPEKNTYSLSGIIRCSSCGSTIVRSSDGYMQCCGYAHGSCKASQSTRQDKLMAVLVAAISDDIKNNVYHLSQRKIAADDSDRQVILGQIEREQQRLTRAREAYLSGADSVDEYKENKTAIQGEISRLEERLKKTARSEAEKNSAAKTASFRERCQQTLSVLLGNELSETEKNAILKLLIEKAVYNKSEQTMEVFYL